MVIVHNIRHTFIKAKFAMGHKKNVQFSLEADYIKISLLSSPPTITIKLPNFCLGSMMPSNHVDRNWHLQKEAMNMAGSIQLLEWWLATKVAKRRKIWRANIIY